MLDKILTFFIVSAMLTAILGVPITLILILFTVIGIISFSGLGKIIVFIWILELILATFALIIGYIVYLLEKL